MSFQKQVSCPVGGNNVGIAIGDLDGDGIPDVAGYPETGFWGIATSAISRRLACFG